MPQVRSAPRETFGKRLARLRRARGLTQGELGEKLGISQRMVAYYEGQTDRPPAHVLDKLHATLRVSMDQLLGVKAVEGDSPVNLRIWRRFKVIEELSAADRMVLWKFIKTLLAEKSAKSK